jgi:hypothetical protein
MEEMIKVPQVEPRAVMLHAIRLLYTSFEHLTVFEPYLEISLGRFDYCDCFQRRSISTVRDAARQTFRVR